MSDARRTYACIALYRAVCTAQCDAQREDPPAPRRRLPSTGATGWFSSEKFIAADIKAFGISLTGIALKGLSCAVIRQAGMSKLACNKPYPCLPLFPVPDSWREAVTWQLHPVQMYCSHITTAVPCSAVHTAPV